ncbi:hypothetical protein PoB_002227100 [Plakobranchus ocellatus]|uniref:Uncharacterized protein n=1 Tax=Plakobranchus ocellatus TaxID=259542 RepID=A0AAV3Z8Y9_9GAST|nr:hypothetical protein PoB_002227100 [Plakobranchus ocellatus]
MLRASFTLLTMSDHSREIHQSFEKIFQKDTIKEFELIDPSFLAHVDDIMSELGLIEDDKPNASSSVTLTQPETEEICLAYYYQI